MQKSPERCSPARKLLTRLSFFRTARPVSAPAIPALTASLPVTGYVVASIDHSYLNIFTRFSDGELAIISQRYLNALNSALAGGPAGQQEMMAMYRVRVEDMRFTLDQIEGINQNGTAELLPVTWICSTWASSVTPPGRPPQQKPAGRTAAARLHC